MPYGFRNSKVRSSALKGNNANSKSRRTSNITRAKYQPPTARNQRKQIVSNAYTIAKLVRLARMNKVYTDYQFASQAELTPNVFAFLALTDFSSWNPVLRQNTVARAEKNATLLHIILNLRFSMSAPAGVVTSPQYWSFFVITPRTHSQGNPVVAWVNGDDYIFNNPTQQANIRLNPGRWKVLASRYMTLTKVSESQSAVPASDAGNPLTTYRKAQITLKTKTLVKNPNGAWLAQSFDLLPPWQRIYIVVFCSTTDPLSTPRMYYDSVATMLTST